MTKMTAAASGKPRKRGKSKHGKPRRNFNRLGNEIRGKRDDGKTNR